MEKKRETCILSPDLLQGKVSIEIASSDHCKIHSMRATVRQKI
uniref:Uncharacterized protein n=1 Tax=Setaria italica TaxID=4555 RepID=K4A3P3_SETIT